MIKKGILFWRLYMSRSVTFHFLFYKQLLWLLVIFRWNIIETFQIYILMKMLSRQLIKPNLWKVVINFHSTLMITFFLNSLALDYSWICFILHSMMFMNTFMLVCILHIIFSYINTNFFSAKVAVYFHSRLYWLPNAKIQNYETEQSSNPTILETYHSVHLCKPKYFYRYWRLIKLCFWRNSLYLCSQWSPYQIYCKCTSSKNMLVMQ